MSGFEDGIPYLAKHNPSTPLRGYWLQDKVTTSISRMLTYNNQERHWATGRGIIIGLASGHAQKIRKSLLSVKSIFRLEVVIFLFSKLNSLIIETVQANFRLGSKFICSKKSTIFAPLSGKLVKITNSSVDNNAWISVWLHQKLKIFQSVMFLGSVANSLKQSLDYKILSSVQ